MLYIHIGFHKTGSTTIQGFMKANRETLEKHGIVYPKIGLTGAHFQLAKTFRKSRANNPYKSNSWAALSEAIQARPDHNFVISAETFHTLSSADLNSIRRELDGIEIKVIAYIRDMSQQIPSRYAQRVKTGQFDQDFDVFCQKTLDKGGDEGFQYFMQLNRWAKVFGWDAIRVRPLDKRVLVGGDLVHDFVDAIGAKYAQLEPELQPNSASVRNQAPGWKALELLRVIHAGSGARTMMNDDKLKEKRKEIALVASGIRHIGLAVAEQLGLSEERGHYMTLDQWNRVNSLYDSELEKINAHITDTQLPVPDRSSFTEREFLPTASRVPAEERANFFQHLLLEFAADRVDAMLDGGRKSRKARIAEIRNGPDHDADTTEAQPAKPHLTRKQRRKLQKASDVKRLD